jgi:hypothetical protein
LTERAGQVAALGAQGNSLGPGQEMKEGFFFHRIEIQGRDLVIREGKKLAALVFPHSALTACSILDAAEMGAELTLHGAAFQ